MSREANAGPVDVAGNPTLFYGRLAELLTAGKRVALCTILRLAGSGPRQAGAKMLIREGGGSIGTVGGGVLESRTAGWAQEALRSRRPLCRSFALNLQQASDEGMTCGGEVEVLIEPLDGGPTAARDFFTRVVDLLTRGERGWLATAVYRDEDRLFTDHCLVASGRSVASLSNAGRRLPEDLLRAPAPTAPSLVERGVDRYFLEPLAPPITVYVFGGGHIGLHLVPLCHLLGFRTVVVDDRPEFASRDRFPQADEVLAVPSFERVFESLPVDEKSCVVIVTRGHGGDEVILRQALRRGPDYVGMIGSSRKRGLIYSQLTAEGFAQEELARVACPIGLSIEAETPEEIAVSIAAQLVATRAARRGKA